MKLLDRVLLLELLVPFLVGTVAVVLMLIGNMLFFYAEQFFAMGVPVVAILQMIIYHTPFLLVLTLPVGTALSVSLAVNRLARDSEIVALRGAGASLRRIFLPLFGVGLLVSVVNFWLEESVVPHAERQFRRVRDRIFLMQTVPLLRSNVVFRMRDFAFYIGLVERAQGNRAELRDVQVWDMSAPGYSRMILAPRAVYDDGVWRLYDAQVHIYGKDGFAIDARTAGEITINLRVALEEVISPPSPEETNAADLRRQALELQKARIPATRLWVGYHFKYSLPFACAVFALCSAPLAMYFARAGSFMGVLLAIILVFVFWNTLLLARLLGNQGILPPVVAAWSPNALFTVGGLLMLWRSE